MTGPKHLWSDGWEDESVAAKPPPDHPAAAGNEAPRQAPETEQPPPPRRRVGRTAWIATGAVVLVAAAAIVLPNLRSSPTRSRTTPTNPATLSTPTSPGTPTFPRTQTIPTVPTTPTTPATPTTPSPSTTSPTPSAVVPSPTLSMKPISWLGMEIVTLAPDAAVVETVALNSEGDRAGVEPGDVIQTVGGHPVMGAEGIVSAVRDARAGDEVPLQIARRSAIFETQVRMGAQPTSP